MLFSFKTLVYWKQLDKKLKFKKYAIFNTWKQTKNHLAFKIGTIKIIKTLLIFDYLKFAFSKKIVQNKLKIMHANIFISIINV